jgi:hypothetical protein
MRPRLLALALFGALVASSACAVDATAPSRLAAPESAVASKGQEGSGQSGDEHGNGGSGVSTYRVWVDPTRANLLHFGRHTLSLPANAVCSIHTSGYGLALFDEPCATETRPVTITAMVTSDALGHPRIDFRPDLRFSPTKEVVLSLSVKDAAAQSITNWRIFYCPTPGTTVGCMDESLLDPSLVTHVDVRRGIVFRRIKHFTGYFVQE